MIKIFLLEDIEYLRMMMRTLLEAEGFLVDEAVDIKSAVSKLQHSDYDVFVLDMALPDGTSIALLDQFPEKTDGRTIIVTAQATIPGVVEAIKKGAYNYLEKPIDGKLLIAQIHKIIEISRLTNRSQSLIEEMGSNFTFDRMVYESKQMEEVVSRAKILAGTDNTILIHGETGTGKEVISHAIHNHSKRKKNIFLPINCAAIPQELFESELFGFEKGAFTGAVSNHEGRFIQASEGTLFLDEIGELPIHIQAKLLRILDERKIYRLKSQDAVDINIRLLAATNRVLIQEVKAKEFRNDLYYRLQESSITIPALRERQEDILPLFRHFLKIFNHVYNKEVSNISKGAENILLAHRWEGNTRELKNTVKSIIPFKTTDTIKVEDLSSAIVGGQDTSKNKLPLLIENESAYILKVLKITEFNISRASEILGITRATLYRKIDQFNLRDVVTE
ncbi:MAG: sigma-54-dependent Fis family transcriptional regulator [bacterium]|nr:sigma-54-dependent Fis family transcriptional regulator [bacterium]